MKSLSISGFVGLSYERGGRERIVFYSERLFVGLDECALFTYTSTWRLVYIGETRSGQLSIERRFKTLRKGWASRFFEVG